VDPARFAAELPRLFDDFPSSEEPHGARFDDIVSDVPNLARENNFVLINLAASLLEAGESYLEAGAFWGASLVAAARGNAAVDLLAIDNFSFGSVTEIDRTVPAADRAELERTLERHGVAATILEGDTNDVLASGTLAGKSIGVFYYDACHDYDRQLEALRLVEPVLASPALVIVDDSEWKEVRDSVRDYVGAEPRAELLLEIPGREAGYPHWWHGMMVVAWS